MASDDRLGEGSARHPFVLAGPTEAQRGAARQLLEVGAGAEGAVLAGEYSYLGIVIDLKGHEGVMQGLHGRHRAGVSRRRPVDDGGGHRTVAFDQNIVACHSRVLP